jgi:hypothetical protein
MSEKNAGGLEELFGVFDDPVAPEEPAKEVAEKPRSWVPFALRNLLLIAIATVVAQAGLRSAGIGVSVLLVIAAFVALRLLMLAVALVAAPSTPKPGSRRSGGEEDGMYHWGGTDALRVAVRRWEQSLGWSQSDAERFSRNVLPVLAELTDERLRLRHGITRATDPRRARELIGEPLWQFLADPGRRPPKARDLTAYVETLERL